MNHSQLNKSYVDNKKGRRPAVLMILMILVLIRIGLSSRLPAYILPYAIHDDAWCATKAMNILDWQWLGPYDQYTLIKGVFAPILIAASYVIGIPYLETYTYLYCIGCIVFVAALSPAIRSWLARMIIFVILLFNPITYALETFQRIYRNGLSQWQLLFIFGGIIALFLRRNGPTKKLLPWTLMTGIVAWTFFNTREDGMWLYPFLIVSTIVLLIVLYNELPRKQRLKKVAISLLPVAILICGNIGVALINQTIYGVYLTNDRDSGAYADVMRDLYMIQPDPEDEALYSSEAYADQYYNIYVSTLQKAYDASPTFKSVQSEVDAAVQIWDGNSGIIGDGQPYADHILFAIRDGVAAAGYYKDLADTENFYQQVHRELKDAFDYGTLKKRNAISLSAMAAPLTTEDLPEIFAQIPRAISFVLSFQNVSAGALPSAGDRDTVYAIEGLTGNRSIVGEPGAFSVSGWALLFSDEAVMDGAIFNLDGQKLADLSFEKSEDVYQFYKDMGKDYKNAKTCRFSCAIPNQTSAEGMILRVWDENHPVNSIECMLGNILKEGGAGFEQGHINIDAATYLVGTEQAQIDAYSHSVQRANWVIEIYKRCNPTFTVFGVLCYLFLCVMLFLSKKQMNQELLAVVLLLTGLLLSFIVFIGMMSYMTVTTFSAENYLYLSSAYVLMLAFSAVSCCAAFDLGFQRYKDTNHRK